MTEASLKPGWRKWRFDQIATNVNDRIDNPSESDFEYYVGLEHIDPDSLKLRRWGSPSDVEATKLIFRKGDIIFGRRRVYQRKVAVAEFDGICSAHALVLRAKQEIVLPEFLPFFMQSDLFMERAKAISVGSLSPTINWKTLAKEEFFLPSVDEQKSISTLLDRSTHVIEAQELALKESEVLYDAFLEEKLKSTQQTGKRAKIKSVCKEITVGIVVNPSKYYAEKGVPGIRHSNVMKGEFDLSDLIFIDPAANEKLKKTQLKQGDVVLPRVSTILGKPYYAAAVSKSLAGVNSIGVVILRPDEKKVNSGFMEAYLNAPSMVRRLVGVAVGSIQRQLNTGIIKEEFIFYPPLDEQKQIAEQSAQIKESIRNLKGQVIASRKLLTNLQQTVFG